VSWKALDWATESEVKSAIAKFILLLLANKADENFSCYPSIRTLMAESGSGRSTVLRALKKLEADGFVTRNPQFHDSGAQRVSRYYLNHPLAPHLSSLPRPNATPPRPDTKRAPSQRGTPGVSDRDPTGVSQRDPLNPTSKPPTEPCADATSVLRAMPASWRIDSRDGRSLMPALEAALTLGWTAESLAAHLARNPDGVRYPARVLAQRLANLPNPPTPIIANLPWCRECEDPRSRTITVTLSDGSEAAAFCSRCSPQEAKRTKNIHHPDGGR
jgi:hypothetical protein